MRRYRGRIRSALGTVQDLLNIGGGHFEVQAGALVLKKDGDAGVHAAPAAVHRFGKLFARHVGETHRHAQLLTELYCQGYVLVGQLEHEGRRLEGALDVLAYRVEETATPAGAVTDGVEQGERVDAALDAHCEALCQGGL